VMRWTATKLSTEQAKAIAGPNILATQITPGIRAVIVGASKSLSVDLTIRGVDEVPVYVDSRDKAIETIVGLACEGVDLEWEVEFLSFSEVNELPDHACLSANISGAAINVAPANNGWFRTSLVFPGCSAQVHLSGTHSNRHDAISAAKEIGAALERYRKGE
jgi:hypothetical protein